ncbi:MAG: 5-formyltetrahydrofolate cyclo-ligase [Caldimonas sp.]
MSARRELRLRLQAERALFLSGAMFQEAETHLTRHLRKVLLDLEPQVLGLYWPWRGEFNARGALVADPALLNCAMALPFAQRAPREMQYRLWDGNEPRLRDECGIPASDGTVVVPDVVVAPCVGYTDDGYRLGYGGGYFDRWLAAHPHVCAIGVAFASARIETSQLVPEAHDVPMTLVLTEHGPV